MLNKNENISGKICSAKYSRGFSPLFLGIIAGVLLVGATMVFSSGPNLAPFSNQQISASAPASVFSSIGDFFGNIFKSIHDFFFPSASAPAAQIPNTDITVQNNIPDAPPPEIPASPPMPNPPPPASAANTIQASPPQIIERIVEKPVYYPATSNSYSKAEVDTLLQQMNNKLSSQVYAASSQQSAATNNVYQVVAQTNKIDTLTNTTINSPTISNAIITGATSISGVNGSFSGGLSTGGALSVSATSTFAGATFSGTVGIGTSTPYAMLSVAGQIVGQNFVATSTAATSTFAGGATFATGGGNVGIGYSTPMKKLSVAGKFYSFKNADVTAQNYITSNSWISRTIPASNAWRGITWSPELGLFVVVGASGTGNRVMTSPDGITWTTRASAADNGWNSVVWSPELRLFVAVSNTGVGNRVMTSPDGITWTSQVSAADNNWNNVTWSPELHLFVAVSSTTGGVNNHIMTSPDGVTWTERTAPSDNQWFGVTWSPELGLFAATSVNGSGNRVMTSSDGINWTARVSAADNQWYGIAWSPELGLFVAVAESGTGNRIMTSPDGISWTSRTSPADLSWENVKWSPELGLFVAISNDGAATSKIMYSSDGITWSAVSSPGALQRLVWSPELGMFAAVGGGSVVTSVSSKLSPMLALPFKAGLTEFTITAAGNVGIASTSPAAKLSLSALSSNTSPLVLISTSTASATSTAFIIDSNGNVGIGTSAVLGPLTTNSGAYLSNGGTWTNASSRALKDNFAVVDSNEILNKINSLPITEWNYKTEATTTTHIGPVAEDFYNLFHLGGNNISISTIDPAGVALAGIQALSKMLNIQTVSSSTQSVLSAVRLDSIESRLAALETVQGTGNALSNITSLVASAVSAVKNLAVDTISAVTGVFKNLTAQDKLCVGGTCINEAQFRIILEKASLYDALSQTQNSVASSSGSLTSTGGGGSQTSTASSSPPSVGAPTITLLGNNPANISVGETFIDPGATAVDATGASLMPDIFSNNVNTSAAGSYEVVWTAHDSQMNFATSTRAVIVSNPNQQSAASSEASSAATSTDSTAGTASTSSPQAATSTATTAPN